MIRLNVKVQNLEEGSATSSSAFDRRDTLPRQWGRNLTAKSIVRD
jgi:hypothetical protein